ncbi:phosphopentomutase [Lactobacillus sp. B4005]|uniref:phosphopentomutase n=1 Tax=Lactobacillus sp. B4005 TaxID=2818031 RepID=UPI00226A837B|nr:phosphopentomutase [Lactobacillus sp. B4005]MCX8723829.1 phosphopentomutase [Lactobacillus sp. B4005]
MSKFGVIVLDGFGVGAMADVPKVRPHDVGSNTALNIIKAEPNIDIPNLEKLGLMNAVGVEWGRHVFSPDANWGTSLLKHHGADSYLGHQEIMGTNPPMPLLQPFNEVIDQVEEQVKKDGFFVKRYGEPGLEILVVNDCATIADNLEADPGQVYNVTATLDKISFDEIIKIGEAVRKVVKVSRVIAFGGSDVTIEDILNARQIKNEKYVGISAPESGVYKRNYHVVHLGYGIDPNVQLASILIRHGIDVALIGKASDIVRGDTKKRFPGVDSNYLFDQFVKQAKEIRTGLIFMNIQETDLAGHSEDTDHYVDILETVNRRLPEAEQQFTGDDILIVMADHGDDPTIGYAQHTREKVPLLIYKENVYHKYVGERVSLSDIGATGAEFFGVEMPQNGTSFLNRINGGVDIS